MNNIKIKVKKKEPSDESILTQKNFSTVIDQHNTIKRSYAKVASLWGATIGMTVFLTFAVTETIGSSNDVIKEQVQQKVIATNKQELEKATKILSTDIIETPSALIEKSPLSTSSKKEDTKALQQQNSTVITEEKNMKSKESNKINVRYIP